MYWKFSVAFLEMKTLTFEDLSEDAALMLLNEGVWSPETSPHRRDVTEMEAS